MRKDNICSEAVIFMPILAVTRYVLAPLGSFDVWEKFRKRANVLRLPKITLTEIPQGMREFYGREPIA